MNRTQWEHVIAAAANVTGLDAFVVIGSQAILGPHPDAPEELLRSQEADIYPLGNPALADAIEGALGDGSQFAATYGYFAHGVGPETAKPPRGWEKRLVRIPIPPRVGSAQRPVAYCLEPHDLVLAKLGAERDRDWEFAEAAIRGGVVDVATLLACVGHLPRSAETIERITAWLHDQAADAT